MSHLPTVEEVLNDPSTSHWLKQALSQAVQRDPVDSLRDAELLQNLLEQRVISIVGGESKS